MRVAIRSLPRTITAAGTTFPMITTMEPKTSSKPQASVHRDGIQAGTGAATIMVMVTTTRTITLRYRPTPEAPGSWA